MTRHLPERPPEGYIEWAESEGAPDIDVDLMLYSAERVKVYPPMEMVRDHSQEIKPKSIWVAHCSCTGCGEDFYTQHVNNGMKGFLMYQGEDGCLYPVDPKGSGEPLADEIDDFGYDNSYIEITEGDGLACPNCCRNVEAMHRSNIRGGRTKQILGCSVQNIGGYTAVIYWLTANRIYDDGSHTYETYPRDAYVLTEHGGIVHYRHTRGAASGFSGECRLRCWEMTRDCGSESVTKPYHSWGNYNNRVLGQIVWERVPFLGDCTGEKTGLDDYIRGGGSYPLTYLKIWQKHRNVENLIRAGWVRLIDENILRYSHYGRSLSTEVRNVDFSKRKPHEMLLMSKGDFRALSQTKDQMGMEVYDQWAKYRNSGGGCTALQFIQYYKTFHASGLSAVLALREADAGIDFPKVAAYLDKQQLAHSDAHLLLDARQMAQELHPDTPLSPAELWPRRLRVVHDELNRLQLLAHNKEKSEKLNAGFQEIRRMFGDLEWNDGDLRILLPKCNEDLLIEGQKLNHCVGRYGSGHVAGSGVIFFVRKYRRPERSYYTLDIKMNGSAPQEVQLHGYGNERHGPNNCYTHKIPDKVRKFVDRWKQEILMPWWLDRMNKTEKEKSA